MTEAPSTIELTGKLLIGNDEHEGTEGTIRAVDPRTGEELEPAFGLGDSGDVDRAAALAWSAFGIYRSTGLEERASFLEKIADNIEALGDQLIERVVAESGLTEARVRGERGRTTGQLRLFADVVREGSWLGARIDPALPDRQPLPREDIRQRKVPVGPVAVFGASNFPLAFSVAGGDTASALAAGAPVIVKAHGAHPGTSELVGRAILSAVQSEGMPEGTFSLLHGSGPRLGTALVKDPRIKAVGFTGSRGGGLALVEAAASRTEPIPVYAEMSSVNPVFLLPEALAANAAGLARDFVGSLTMGSGQFCTNPGVLFAIRGDATSQFLETAVTALSETAPAPMLTPGIARAYDQGIAERESAVGVEEIAMGPDSSDIAAFGGARVHTVGIKDFFANPVLHEEIFGAAALIVQLDDDSQFTDVAELLEGQLTATIHSVSADHGTAAELLSKLELKAGRVLFNGWPTGVEVGHAMVHGGPFPATSDNRTTSVGTLAIERFLRPVAYQNVPSELLPPAVDESNSLKIWRRVDGQLGKD